MTPTEIAAELRVFNDWRRGGSCPPAREIGEAIDAAVEMIYRLEEAESDALEQARLNGMGGEREAALMAKLEAAEKAVTEAYQRGHETGQEEIAAERDTLRSLVVMRFDHDHPPQFTQGYDTHELTEPVTAEHCRWFVAEIERLRAKIEQMERQEPVGKFIQHPSNGLWEQDGYGDSPDARPLYALPGAQPAPSVPDVWLPVPEKHPTFYPVDLQLSDGSVLCGCVPQSDGDYWWEGPSGEVFIDPKYAPVTHWRISAAPEVKP